MERWGPPQSGPNSLDLRQGKLQTLSSVSSAEHCRGDMGRGWVGEQRHLLLAGGWGRDWNKAPFGLYYSPTLFFCQDSQCSEEKGEAFPEKNKKVLLKAAAVRNPVLEVFFQLSNSSSPLQSNLESPPSSQQVRSPPSTPGKLWLPHGPRDRRTPSVSGFFLGPDAFLGLVCLVSWGFCFLFTMLLCPVVQGPWTQQHTVLKEKPWDSGQTGHFSQSPGLPERLSGALHQPQSQSRHETAGHQSALLENLEHKDYGHHRALKARWALGCDTHGGLCQAFCWAPVCVIPQNPSISPRVIGTITTWILQATMLERST